MDSKLPDVVLEPGSYDWLHPRVCATCVHSRSAEPMHTAPETTEQLVRAFMVQMQFRCMEGPASVLYNADHTCPKWHPFLLLFRNMEKDEGG